MYKQYFYRKIDSTQLEIWRRIEANKIDNKTVVIADIQMEKVHMGENGIQMKLIILHFLFLDKSIVRLIN